MPALDFPEEVKVLVAHLKRLPGVGPKSAERIAVWLLAQDGGFSAGLADSVRAAAEGVRACPDCGFFASASRGCQLCADPARERSTLCVVEQPTDVLPLERTGAFKGGYLCLGGKIAPLENIGPEDLRIGALVARLGGGEVSEVILGVGSDVEGEATANYLAELLAVRFPEVAVSRLAQGLPAGGGLDNADELTLFRALDGRRRMGG